MVILGGSLIRWIIFSTPSLICLPIYLKMIVIFVTLIGGLVAYEISKMRLGKSLLSIKQIYITKVLGSIWNIDKPRLKKGVDPTPKILCKNQFRQWTLSNEYILLIKYHCLKPLELHKKI